MGSKRRSVKTGDGRVFQIVEICRAGSGDCVVREPSEEWFSTVKKINSNDFIYSKMRVAIIPGNKSGYGQHLTCEIFFLPGDGRGMIQPANGKKEAGKVWPQMRNFKIRGVDYDSKVKPHPFGISTNLEDLKEISKALTKAIKNMEELEERFRPKTSEGEPTPFLWRLK